MDKPTDNSTVDGSTVVSGTIDTETLSGGIDLHLTLASGQSYRWRSSDGAFFEAPTSLPTPWYETVADGIIIRVRDVGDALEYRGTPGVENALYRLLRLEDDLDAMLAAGPDLEVYDEAVEHCRGMRLVEDSLYVGLLSFVCSTNMRVERIHQMVQTLMERFGETYRFDDRTFYGFPEAEVLASASVDELRECGLGYRAPYVKQTAEAIATGDVPLPGGDLEYEQRRSALQAYHGVGPKVADCALLFGAGDLEAVPLDRWIERAIEAYLPECVGPTYEDTSRAIRSALGPYPGYAQTYLFHHLRTNDVLE